MFLCEPLYKSGLADTNPVVAEKLTTVPFLLLRANSLHTENRYVKFTSIILLNDSNERLNRVCFFLPF